MKIYKILILILIFNCPIVHAEKVPEFVDWIKVSTFDKGVLYKSRASDKITLSWYHEGGHSFIFNKKFIMKDYIEGISITRKASFSIGGLKNWKHLNTLSFNNSQKKMSIVFKGQYERFDGKIVTLYELHSFRGSNFDQWQIIADSDERLLTDQFAIKTFDRIINEDTI